MEACAHSGELLHQMIDVVSKNGNFMLNLGPRPDGTFDGPTVALLHEIGDWLAVNGEAVYGSRTFEIYGEGPTHQMGHVAFAKDRIPYTAEDIRFTRKENALYVFLLGWPFAEKISVKGKQGFLKEEIRKVTMLGNGGELGFVQDTAALTVTLPREKPCNTAWVLKLET